jgi:DNA-binding MarR family transcriptional regulator
MEYSAMEETHTSNAREMTERMLLRAFMHMSRVEWHDRVIAGCTASEIRVLLCIRHGINPVSAYGHVLSALRDKIRSGADTIPKDRIEALRAMLNADDSAANKMKVSQISRMLGVTSPAITQIVKGLEAKGLVERQDDADDKRMVNFRLTLHGDVILSQAILEMLKSIRGLMDYLGEEESTHLAALLMKSFSYFSERAVLNAASQWNGESEI